jgi:predicted small metal-binding protein
MLSPSAISVDTSGEDMTQESGIKRLRCACGWETVGTEDEVVEAAREHGRRMHNMEPTREQVLAMLLPATG